jgi:hypothetical protein
MKMKHIKLFESFTNEDLTVKPGSIKISNFKVNPDSARLYATSKYSIGFSATINGKSVKGSFGPTRQYTCEGVDINELTVDGKRITICSGGGSHRTYEISIGPFKQKEKQPKDLRFTGPYYDLSDLGNQFKTKLVRVVGEKPELLTDEFKKTFGI